MARTTAAAAPRTASQPETFKPGSSYRRVLVRADRRHVRELLHTRDVDTLETLDLGRSGNRA